MNIRRSLASSAVPSLLALVVGAGCGVPSNNPLLDLAVPCDGDPGSCGGGGCTSDVQCTVQSPRCDKNSGRCVPCLPLNDNCPIGSHCVAQNGGFVCASACRTSADCPRSDAGGAKECCNAACLDTMGDRANCGGCGKVCAPLANTDGACVAGVCGVGVCNAGFGDCNQIVGDGCEAAITTDGKNCGACGNVCPVVQNGSGSCTAGKCTSMCNAGFLHCSMIPEDGCEVNGANDPKNCGACGNVCPMGVNGQVACINGVCGLTQCNAGFADCDKMIANGCEVATGTDQNNCGACGVACSAANASVSCAAGKCVVGMCNMGFANCDGLPGNGCEAKVDADIKNCGACARVCTAPNGVPGCANGACTIASCSAGFADCNGNAADGCETRVGSDVGNCGGCGKACPMVANGTPACVNAGCAVASCKFGFADCDLNFANGCEANLLTPQSCGACNVKCPMLPHASAGCVGGVCGIGMCDPLFGDCDGNPQNGCERSLGTDAQSCGGCNVICALPNATQSCVAGACVVGVCLPGFADCDGKPANGCEVQTSVDVSHCGACGKACPPGANAAPTCANGACGLGCNANFADCDKMAGNGCEAALLTDVNNCNGCGTVCGNVINGSRGCVAGRCAVAACNMGFADCDNNVVTGCEKSLNSDVNNCGACGKLCTVANGSASCTNGACTVGVCNAGFADCDNNPANGCEVNLKFNNASCGACGVACGGMTPVCLNSVCVAGCVGVPGANIAAVMPGQDNGFCWYLGIGGRSCDTVCAAAGGGTNQANAAMNAFANDCNGGGANQPATYFFQNGNKGNWNAPAGFATGYRSLGHGYANSQYYGKCSTSADLTVGTLPGSTNADATRSLVCACSK